MIKGLEDTTFGNLISRRQPFEVPKYQRSYAWTDDEIDDFVSDIKKLVEARRKAMPQSRPHFFGGVVCVEKFAPNTMSGRAYDVVDGQQRLATFMLTMSLIVRAFEQVSKMAAAAEDETTRNTAVSHVGILKEDYLFYKEIDSNGAKVERPRLSLSRSDRVFFEALITDTERPRAERLSHELLLAAVQKLSVDLIDEEVFKDTASAAESLARAITLKDAVLEDCYAIFITSEDRKAAYTLFTVLNDRGKTLSDGDLLRAFTLEMLEGDESRQDDAERRWDAILGGDEQLIEKFLASFYASSVGKRPRERDVFDGICQSFFDGFKQPITPEQRDQVFQFVVGLEAELGFYQKLTEGEWPYEGSTVTAWQRDRLYRLVKVMRHALCLPLLVPAARYLPENVFAELVLRLERFVFRYVLIVRAHPTRLADAYYDHALLIRSQKASFGLTEVRRRLKGLAATHAPDALFSARLRERLQYSTSSQERQLIKHFLTTIEDHWTWLEAGASNEPKPQMDRVFDIVNTTIEHIYPQNAAAGDVNADLELVKQDLGNLSVWPPNENSAAGNQSFDAKKVLYEKSHVRLNKELASLAAWDMAALEARRAKLVEKGSKIYQIDSIP